MQIEHAQSADEALIRQLHLMAFGAEERDAVSALAVDLLHTKSTPATLSLVARDEGAIKGHVVFSPVFAQETQAFLGYNLAPLAVDPIRQKQGIGSQVVRAGLTQLETQGVGLVLVYGDPNYYGRFGFRAELGEPYQPAYPLEYPFGWQGMMLGGQTPPAACAFTSVPALAKPELW